MQLEVLPGEKLSLKVPCLIGHCKAAKHLGNINGQNYTTYGIFFGGGGWVTNFNPIFGEGSQISILSETVFSLLIG